MVRGLGSPLWLDYVRTTQKVSYPTSIAGVALGESLAQVGERHLLEPLRTSREGGVDQRLAMWEVVNEVDARAELVAERLAWRPEIEGHEASCVLDFDPGYRLARIHCELSLTCRPSACGEIQTALMTGLEKRYGPPPFRYAPVDHPAIGLMNQEQWLWSDGVTRFRARTATLVPPRGQAIARISIEMISLDHLQRSREVKRNVRDAWDEAVAEADRVAASGEVETAEALLDALDDSSD